ncbi:helicase HerA domain-containing protein [Actinoplanes regularis]|uniref:Helicase HerA central domain-containing protein n=1 Tax=Actinoplanes regularis TaxID=52697 RepID=A0A239J4G1_9ACTN|nr:ATP-binding protein [Actinoplanes regularis]GIE91895.1 ATPase [Actinoplanes regularis]SNT00133.1 protein of unknown function DUF87 [Actinoplanes regularis]
MTADALKALAHLHFHSTPTRNDVWRETRFHIDGLHAGVLAEVLDAVDRAESSPDSSPTGVVVRGQRGAGKTHLLSRVRELIQLRGGYFFLVSLLDADAFWGSVAASVVDGLHQPVDDDGSTQLHLSLNRLVDLLGLPVVTRMAVTGRVPLTPDRLDEFVAALGRLNRQIGIGSRDTARALALLAGSDARAQDVAMSYLLAGEEAEVGERAAWGIRPAQRFPQHLVSDVSRLLSLTGPSVVAVDQVDGLIAQVANRSHTSADGRGGGADGWAAAVQLDRVASGLMELRELTRRTVSVLALLPVSWAVIKGNAVDTVQDRFREASPLEAIPDRETGRALIERRLTAHYAETGFVPPYASWPIRPEAFDDAVDFTPRQLLINVERHIRSCVQSGTVTELTHLGTVTEAPTAGPAPAGRPALEILDERYAALRAAAPVGGLLDPANEDAEVPALLAAGLDAWVRENPDDDFTQDTIPTRKPVLHARLRRTLDDRTGDEAHWAFRAIAAQHYNAELARLRNACVAAGLASGVAQRRLYILRNDDWPKSPGRRKAVEEFVAAGGQTLPLGENDLRSLVALRTLLAEESDGLSEWLIERRPASRTALLKAALADAGREMLDGNDPDAGTVDPVDPADVPQDLTLLAAGATRDESDSADPADVPRQRPPQEAVDTPGGVYLRVGDDCETGDPVHVELTALRKHTAIFAGSGSGKTVLIRRLVEECALLGVSAIVLDPNNDLARLGDAWPREPRGWAGGDAQAAADYHDAVEVVVWTPGREGGRPLTFQPLPDLGEVSDDPDEFTLAVDSAVDALAPRAQVAAATAKAMRGQAVLRQVLRHYGRTGDRSSLDGLIALLRDLPEGVSELAGAAVIAADMAENLDAARINDPLFGGTGDPADPGTLLSPAPGKRARVSVISFVGRPARRSGRASSADSRWRCSHGSSAIPPGIGRWVACW